MYQTKSLRILAANQTYSKMTLLLLQTEMLNLPKSFKESSQIQQTTESDVNFCVSIIAQETAATTN